jgi:hypothetical protein
MAQKMPVERRLPGGSGLVRLLSAIPGKRMRRSDGASLAHNGIVKA